MKIKVAYGGCLQIFVWRTFCCGFDANTLWPLLYFIENAPSRVTKRLLFFLKTHEFWSHLVCIRPLESRNVPTTFLINPQLTISFCFKDGNSFYSERKPLTFSVRFSCVQEHRDKWVKQLRICWKAYKQGLQKLFVVSSSPLLTGLSVIKH